MGAVRRTARVSIARRDIKKALHKIFARLSGITYEAVSFEREDISLKPIIFREDGDVYVAYIWNGVRFHCPGKTVGLPRNKRVKIL
jgi:hypothetical protein